MNVRTFLTLLLTLSWWWSVVAQQPEVVVQTGHASQIFTLEYSADGRLVFSASSDNTANVWDVTTGMAIRSFEGHAARITAATMRADGRRIVIAGLDEKAETIRIWDLDQDAPLRDLISEKVDEKEKAPEGILDMALNPDGRLLATKSRKKLKIWDMETGELQHEIKIKTPAVSLGKTYSNTFVAFSKDGTEVLADCRPKKFSPPSVVVWNVGTGEMTRTMELKPKKGLNIPNVSLGNPLKSGGLKAASPIKATWYAVSPDGSHLCYFTGGSVNVNVELWNLATGARIRKIDTGKSFGKVASSVVTRASAGDRASFSVPLAFSQDNTQFALAMSGKVMVYDVKTGEKIRTLNFANVARMVQDKLEDRTKKPSFKFEGYSSLAFHPGGKTLSGGGGQLSGLRKGEEKKSVQLINVWNLETGREVLRLKGQYNRVRSLAFVPRTGKLVSGGNRVHTWDLQTGRVETRSRARGGDFLAVAVSGDGKVFATTQKNQVITTDLRTDLPLKKIAILSGADRNFP
ncbi:MAG: hypothetical protein AAF570_17265, partial [Bacteroidota bacterium]